MAVGRHRMMKGVLYGRKRVRDSRGNIHVVPDKDRAFVVNMAVRGVRSNKAEAKGQLTNEVYTLFVDPVLPDGSRLPDVGVWGMAECDGRVWDLSSPLFLKRGRRRTEHWEAEVRARPPSDLTGVVDALG